MEVSRYLQGQRLGHEMLRRRRRLHWNLQYRNDRLLFRKDRDRCPLNEESGLPGRNGLCSNGGFECVSRPAECSGPWRNIPKLKLELGFRLGSFNGGRL